MCCKRDMARTRRPDGEKVLLQLGGWTKISHRGWHQSEITRDSRKGRGRYRGEWREQWLPVQCGHEKHVKNAEQNQAK